MAKKPMDQDEEQDVAAIKVSSHGKKSRKGKGKKKKGHGKKRVAK